MIEKLAVHVHVKARYVDNLEFIPIIGIFHDVAGQERKAHAALHHIKDEIRIPPLPEKAGFQDSWTPGIDPGHGGSCPLFL